MKIFIVFGHHNTKDSFNASVRDTFIDEAKKIGHEIDLINLFDNQKARMKLLEDDHAEQERADQEKYDNDEMLEIEFNNRKRARAEEMKDLEKKDRLEQLEAFSEMYSAMADVVMAVSANIAQTRMDNIQKEHEQRTEDLNNQFERDLELAQSKCCHNMI